MKYAVIENGIIAVIRPNPAAGLVQVPEDVRAGYVDNGDGTFLPPPTPGPSADPNDYPLEPFQFFAMLEILDKEAAVEAAIDAIPDATQRAVARAKWRHTIRFDRDYPLFSQIAPAVGLTDAEIDAAWMQAKNF